MTDSKRIADLSAAQHRNTIASLLIGRSKPVLLLPIAHLVQFEKVQSKDDATAQEATRHPRTSAGYMYNDKAADSPKTAEAQKWWISFWILWEA
jgi:hypothetical protein